MKTKRTIALSAETTLHLYEGECDEGLDILLVQRNWNAETREYHIFSDENGQRVVPLESEVLHLDQEPLSRASLNKLLEWRELFRAKN
ncbi:MAG: hypothetical protein WA765_00855 [Candidatus Acidiferrum sp.]